MSTYTQIYYHIVFSTKNRENTLSRDRREELYKYIWGIAENKNIKLYRIGGTGNHLHLLIALHPTVPLSEFIKILKTSTTTWIKGNKIFPLFDHWQDGYGAFTVSHEHRDILIEYIKNQEDHHKKQSFREEYLELLDKSGVKYKPEYV